MKRLFMLVLATLAWPALAAGPAVKIGVQWLYKDFPDPVTLYEVKDNPSLWETRSVPGLTQAPIGTPIQGASFELTPGQHKRFAMVVQNTTDHPLYFFAAPHRVQPEEAALGFKFKCLCVNRAYTVGPKEIWYRVLELRLGQNFVGNELTLTHTLVGIDKKRAAAFSTESLMPDM